MVDRSSDRLEFKHLQMERIQAYRGILVCDESDKERHDDPLVFSSHKTFRANKLPAGPPLQVPPLREGFHPSTQHPSGAQTARFHRPHFLDVVPHQPLSPQKRHKHVFHAGPPQLQPVDVGPNQTVWEPKPPPRLLQEETARSDLGLKRPIRVTLRNGRTPLKLDLSRVGTSKKEEMREQDEEERLAAMKQRVAEANGARLWRTPISRTRRFGLQQQLTGDSSVLPQPHMPLAIETDDDEERTIALKILTENWMQSLLDPNARLDFTSEAIYMEAKLQEGLRIAEHLPTPNKLRTAIVCQLLDLMVEHMKYFKPVMASLKKELFRSIFYDPQQMITPMLEQHLDDGAMTRRTPPAFFLDSRTFFEHCRDLRANLEATSEELHNMKEQFLRHRKVAQMSTRAQERNILAWRHVLVASVFRRWQTEHRSIKEQHQLLDKLMKKWTGKGPSLADYFKRWRETLKETILYNHFEIVDALKEKIDGYQKVTLAGGIEI
ncbi:hypothetical protein CYMTET_46638 [Cymbomonas tetramitiformis]|uniref:Uncharacterized protein n=1 Tax=Cymbomonas tetramitiformis TaxID=36881 RepID=A0AAE0EXF0_9CHLO|nr:hypothetical protein CYMTET_46638 [Cymbomonas tetramitiformis]